MAVAPIDVEIADLTVDEAEQITGRIRQWVSEFPTEDVVRAFRGRIWLAMGYDDWAEWCDCELGGFQLPIPQRREIENDLHNEGLSQRTIAEAMGVGRRTVRDDLQVGGNRPPDPDRRVTGPDGKSYPAQQPQRDPLPPAPPPTTLDDICRITKEMENRISNLSALSGLNEREREVLIFKLDSLIIGINSLRERYNNK